MPVLFSYKYYIFVLIVNHFVGFDHDIRTNIYSNCLVFSVSFEFKMRQSLGNKSLSLVFVCFDRSSNNLFAFCRLTGMQFYLNIFRLLISSLCVVGKMRKSMLALVVFFLNAQFCKVFIFFTFLLFIFIKISRKMQLFWTCFFLQFVVFGKHIFARPFS